MWCFGLNDLDQCILYLGSEQSCQNLAPCSTASLRLPIPDSGVTLCFGRDDDTGQCKLFFGTRETCDNVEPCRAVNGRLPRAPLVTPQ